MNSNSLKMMSDNRTAPNLVQNILDAEEGTNVDSLMCGAIKQLKLYRFKPDTAICLSLLYVAKTKPNIFCSAAIIEALTSMLKREFCASFKVKNNITLPILATNILMASHSNETHWPDTFLRIYIEDAIGERVWVDHEDCRLFAANIMTAFNTELPPKVNILPEAPTNSQPATQKDAGSPTKTPPEDEIETMDHDMNEETSSTVLSFNGNENNANLKGSNTSQQNITQRYSRNKEFVEKVVMEHVTEFFTRRAATPADISKNALKFLMTCCGLPKVRGVVVQKIEHWLSSSKLSKIAHDLLITLCLNCNDDDETIQMLIKMRHTWMSHLKNSICSVDFVPQNLCMALRPLLLSETDINYLVSYVEFLTAKDKDQLSLSDELARFIIERPFTLGYVMSEKKLRDQLVKVTLQVFNSHINTLKNSPDSKLRIRSMNTGSVVKEEGSLSDDESTNRDNLVYVMFDKTSQKMPVPIKVTTLHAMITLLTYKESAEYLDEFKELAGHWFGVGSSNSKKAALIYGDENSTETVPLPDKLRLRLIQSSDNQLVEAGLKGTNTLQQMSFLTSFGIPISTLDKILHSLDTAAKTESDNLRACIEDAHYVKQLVEVYLASGAKKGQNLLKLIDNEMLGTSPA